MQLPGCSGRHHTPGVTIWGYEWVLPGLGTFISTSNTQTFSIPGFNGSVSVRILGVNADMTDDNPTIPVCCDHLMTTSLFCEDGNWNENINGKAIMPKEGELKDITVFPNPSTKDIYIKNPGEEVIVTIIDYTGRIVLNTKAPNGTSQVSLQGKADGLYLININNIGGQLIKSIKLVLKQ